MSETAATTKGQWWRLAQSRILDGVHCDAGHRCQILRYISDDRIEIAIDGREFLVRPDWLMADASAAASITEDDKVTATPWRYEWRFGGDEGMRQRYVIVDGNGDDVLTVYDEATAKHIVRCVNSFEAMRDALVFQKTALDDLCETGLELPPSVHAKLANMRDDADTALALTEANKETA